VVYCITGFSFTPKYCPVFTAINEDGSPFQYKSIIAGGVVIWDLNGGFRLTEKTTPSFDSVYRFAKLTSGHKTLPDIFALPGPVPCVSQAIKDCIDPLEPGVHQFFSMTLLDSKNKVMSRDHYILNVCVLLDSLIFEKSNLSWGAGPGSYAISDRGADLFRTIKGRSAKGHLLWREKIYPHDFYISDEIYKFFKKNKIKGIDKHHYTKVFEE
jgi:hypothetical protein